MYINQNISNLGNSIHEFLFHPLSAKHSTIKRVISVIVCVALSIFSAGIYLAVFIGINTFDSRRVVQRIIEQPKKFNIAEGYEDKIPSKEFTMEEVAKHNTSIDIWIAINDLVFNVTKFLDDHPGGEDVLLNMAGKDATKAFENIGHTPEACRQAMMKWCIGRLV